MLYQIIAKSAVRILRGVAATILGISRSLDRSLLLSKNEKKILKRNAHFKNLHAGKRAFVIVNGPSLADQNIEPLGGEITFVASGFYKHEVNKVWQPTYYCLSDPLFFNGSDECLSFFQEMRNVIFNSIFFIPLFRGYRANKKFRLLPDKRTFYIASAGEPNGQLDMTQMVQGFKSVSSFALAQAIYMGCNPIYLLGFDHDWLANQGVDKHFYKGGILKDRPSNNRPLSELFTYYSMMQSGIQLWRNYFSLKRNAKQSGIKIYNATRGGYLDVFERVEYEKIIEGLYKHKSLK